jgi:hypothetical protein
VVLGRERIYYRAHRAEWVANGHENQWAVIHGTELLGFHDSLHAAVTAGLRRWAPYPFLVKLVKDDRGHLPCSPMPLLAGA